MLQVGATVRTLTVDERAYVEVEANASEMQEVLKTAVAESLELIRGMEIGRDSTSIDIKAMNTNETFDITVHLEHGGRKALVRGAIEKFRLDLNADPHKFHDNSEEGIVSNVTAFVMISQGEDFKVTYWRKPDEA